MSDQSTSHPIIVEEATEQLVEMLQPERITIDTSADSREHLTLLPPPPPSPIATNKICGPELFLTPVRIPTEHCCGQNNGEVCSVCLSPFPVEVLESSDDKFMMSTRCNVSYNVKCKSINKRLKQSLLI